MAGKTWKKYSSTSRAGVGARRFPRRPHRERRSDLLFPAPRRGDDSALLVFAALVLAAPDRADLLAGGADVHVGVSATRRRAPDRRRDGGGEHVSRGVPIVGSVV